MQMIISLPYLETFNDTIICGAKGPSEACHMPPLKVGTCLLPSWSFHHSLWPYQIPAGPQIGFAFLYSALLPMSHQMKWPSLPLYPSGEFLSFLTLSSNFTASQEHSVTFRGRMCSKSTLLFRGNEIELEGTHLEPGRQAVTPLCRATSSKSWGWRCYLAKLVKHLGAYQLTLETLDALS